MASNAAVSNLGIRELVIHSGPLKYSSPNKPLSLQFIPNA